MSTVTQRISEIKQPRGGYIKPSQFAVRMMNDGKTLAESENIHPSIMGLSVDYLTRYMMGAEIQDAFEISILGAKAKSALAGGNADAEAAALLAGIMAGANPAAQFLGDLAITNACKLSTFDVWYRSPSTAIFGMKGAAETNPDPNTIENIRVMVQRSIAFWKEYGPITKDGFTFETDGYTETVDSGDGDFLTADTLWDFKVSKAKPTSKHTLQLLMYWIMGQHSGKEEFRNVTNLGIFNPRLNAVYTLNMSQVPQSVIETVERDVICY